MDLMLHGKIVLLTGATGGIGRQICGDFIGEGATVVAAFRDDEKFAELKQWLQNQGADTAGLTGIKTDVLKKQDIDGCVEKALASYGRIDVLVNCAGASYEWPFPLLSEENIRQSVDLNLVSPVLFSQAVLPPMFRQKGGCIVNISSVAAHKRGRGIVTYASAKAGLDAFTRTLAQEVGKKNIRVNCVRPGMIDTAMSGALRERVGKMVIESTAVNRAGSAEDISAAVLFLASERAAFITGAYLNVDGGLYL